MSEHITSKPSPEELVVTANNAIFGLLSAKLKKGVYYPEKREASAEYVALVPELGDMAAATTPADIIDNPELIHLVRYKVTNRGSVEYRITPTNIDVQHSAYDENSNPYPIDGRHPINSEELVDFYDELFQIPTN